MNKNPNFFSHTADKGRSAGRQKRLSFFLWVRDCAMKQVQKNGGLAFCTAASMVPLTAQAADFTVNTLSDVDADGDTLREAIIAANGTPAVDTISFTPGLSGSLTLAQGELKITRDLIINGPEERITISGNDTSRIFFVDSSTVSLSNMILTEGNSAEVGGAIVMAESQLTLTNCEISNNSSGIGGGGIGGEFGGSLTLINSVVSNNTALTIGGGICTDDLSLTLTNCEVSSNTSGLRGGGIFAEAGGLAAGDLTLTNCMITDNSASGESMNIEGGGIFAIDVGELAISNSVISGNTAISTVNNQGIGGGISCYEVNSIAIEGTEFSNNESSFFGGGISVAGGDVSISNATISENRSNVGGGFGSYLSGLVAFTNCTVTGNDSSTTSGGGIYTGIAENVSIHNCSITGNSANSVNSAGGGGGMSITSFDNDPTSLEIVNTICAFNSSTSGNNDLNLISTIITLGSQNLFSDSSSPDAQDAAQTEMVLLDGVQIIETDPANVFAATSMINGITTGTLADNGGSVPTILLLPGGTAHNVGLDSALTADTQDLDNDGDITEALPVDARGLARVFGSAVDLGAVEIDETSPLELTLVEVNDAGSAVLSFELSQVLNTGDSWILFRSTDLENFSPIFAFNGTTVELEESGNTSSLDSATSIYTIIDTAPPQPKAFYRLEIAPSPAS